MAVARNGTTPIYLDWNATSPLHPEVVAAMQQCASEGWGNPSSVHGVGRIARENIECVRAEIASHFRAHPRDLLFVSGGTEANNLALFDAPALVLSELEHPSVTRVGRELERLGRPVRWLEVLTSGQIDLGSLQDSLCGMQPGAVVALQAVNHETGIVQPLAEAAEIVRRGGAWLHVDAVQALGKLTPERYLYGNSFSIAAHKICGPKGIGAVVWRCGRPAPHPILFGGSQQRGFRPGTLDPIGIAGFGAAFRISQTSLAQRANLSMLRAELENALQAIGESNCDPQVPRLEHVVSWHVPTWRGDELVAAADVEGLCISSGSACSAGTAEPSPVIRAMHGEERARRTIRLSLGVTTTRHELERAAAILQSVVGRVPGSPDTATMVSRKGHSG